jgi:hypothetical protein
MAKHETHDEPTTNKAFGSAGHETGEQEPSELGSAGLYATPIHDEGEEAEEAGRTKAQTPPR